MINVKDFLVLATLSLAAFPLLAEEVTDSVAATNLAEVVVQGERAWIEGNKAIFLPTKKEKNLSNDPATLVKNMHIPTVYVENGQIKSRTGAQIPIFVNGVEANGVDLATFWPKQAIRVEYIDHPKDPQYKGYSAVINFVMEEYLVGGITKGNVYQILPNRGNYNVASKLVYKQMTYNLMIDGGYSRDHTAHSKGEESFNGVYYAGDYYDKIARVYESNSWSRSDNLGAALNAHYMSKDKKLHITHDAGIKWNRNPGSGTNYAEIWSPNLFDSFSSTTFNSSRSVSPQISGRYSYQLTNRSFTALSWSYGYSHRDSHSGSQTGELTPILNGNEENNHSFSAGWRYNTGFHETSKWFFSVAASTSMNWYNTLYSGSANTDYKQWRGKTTLTTQVSYSFSPKLGVHLIPGVVFDYWHSGEAAQVNKISPSAQASVVWAPTRKFSMYAMLHYFTHTPSASYTSDILLRESELMWMRGSTSIKDNTTWMPSVHVNYFLNDNVRLSGMVNYDKRYHITGIFYEQAPPDMGGVIKTFFNEPANDMIDAQFTGTFYFFNKNLEISPNPVYQWHKIRGPYARCFNVFRMRGSMSYTVGNVQFGISYSGRNKYYTSDGRVLGRDKDQWSFDVTYGQGDFYVNASFNNIFHRYYRSSEESLPYIYMNNSESYSNGRSFSINLSYTFGYGKKVDRSIDINGPSDGISGALSH